MHSTFRYFRLKLGRYSNAKKFNCYSVGITFSTLTTASTIRLSLFNYFLKFLVTKRLELTAADTSVTSNFRSSTAAAAAAAGVDKWLVKLSYHLWAIYITKVGATTVGASCV